MVSDVEIGKTPIDASVKIIGCLRKAVGEFSTISRGVVQGTAIGVIKQKLETRLPAPCETNLQGVVDRVGIGGGQANRIQIRIRPGSRPGSEEQSPI